MEDITIVANSAQWLVRKLIEGGFSRDALLRDTALDPDWPWKRNATLSFRQYHVLILRAYQLTGDPSLALNISRQFSLGEFGMMGYAIMSCATLAEALNIAFRFWDLAGQLLKLQVEKSDRYWTINMFSASPLIRGQSFVYAIEECLTSNFAGKSFLVNRRVFPEWIEVSHSAPDYADLYQERFQCEVRFDSGRNRYRMSTDLVGMPVITSQPEMAELCKKQCEEILSQMTRRDRFVDQIRRLIFSASNRPPNIEQISAQLKISSRTLHRRLKERHTTFQAILDEVREETAKRYLAGTNLSIDEISDLMGYAETSSFRRSFKRWSGLNASKWRLQV